MTKPIMLLDVDGPIADWKQGYIDRLNLATGLNYSIDDTGYNWSIEDDLKLDPSIAASIYAEMDGPGIAASLPNTHMAVDAVREHSTLYDLVFLTAYSRKSVDWVHGRGLWLTERFGREQGNKVVHTHYKYLVYGDVFIDDKVDHLVEWQQFWLEKLGKKPKAIRFTCGKTLSDTPEGIVAVRDWAELAQVLKY